MKRLPQQPVADLSMDVVNLPRRVACHRQKHSVLAGTCATYRVGEWSAETAITVGG